MSQKKTVSETLKGKASKGGGAAPAKKKHETFDFSAAAIARAKEAAAKKKSKPEAVVKPPLAAAGRPEAVAGVPDDEQEPLEKGDEGVEWVCLEDCLVRQDRDMKSARCGAVQKGERCTQTGPWRVDPTGRVRMPVRAPRKVVGWVTLDERRCRNSEGQWGIQKFKLAPAAAVSEESESEEEEEEMQKEEEDDLADPFLSAVGAVPAAKKAPLHAARETRAVGAVPAAKAADANGKAGKPRAEAPPDESAEQTAARAELTDAEKNLRNLRKKLRDVEAAATKLRELEAAGAELSEAQRAKVARQKELEEQVEAAEAEVTAEKRDAAPRKRRSPKKPETKQKQKAAKKAAASGKPLRLGSYVVVAFVVLAGVAYFTVYA